jgi:DNA-binding NarL/FixJ family response regulator
MNRTPVDTRTREEILERYRAHAARFQELAARPDRVEPTRDAGWAPSTANTPPTPRQLEILQLIADGLSNGEIARRLFITEETCKSHVRAMLGRLQARSRSEAVAIGFRSGLLF